MNILIIEDNLTLSKNLEKSFRKNSFANIINILHSFQDFLYNSYIKHYDIILIDICLWENKNTHGIEILKHIRKNDWDIPIIMISSHSEYSFLENAFRNGAHDYIIKPFRCRELQIRVERWFRNYVFFKYFTTEKYISYNGLVYYLEKREFYINDVSIPLSKSSKYILLLLLIHKEKLLSKEFLVWKIWWECKVESKNLRVKILRLKKQLDLVWIWSWILTIHGEWYMLQCQTSEN